MAVLQAPSLWIIGDDPRIYELVPLLERNGVLARVHASLRADTLSSIAELPRAVLCAYASDTQMRATLQRWRSSSFFRTVPFLALLAPASLAERMDLYLQGAAGTLAWSPDLETTARAVIAAVEQLARLRPSQSLPMGETTSEELLLFCRDELREGLFQRAGVINQPQVSLDLQLGEGLQVAETVAGFVERLSSLVVDSAVTEEASSTNMNELGLDGLQDEKEWDSLAALHGARVALFMNAPGKADRVATELRANGARVVVSSGAEDELQHIRDFDPEILLVDTSDASTVQAVATIDALSTEERVAEPHVDLQKLLTRVRKDERLRWAKALMIRYDDFQSNGIAEIHRVARQMRSLLEDDRRLAAELHATPVYASVENHGPSKLLRMVESQHGIFHLEAQSAEGLCALDIAEGLLISACWLEAGTAHVPRADVPSVDGDQAAGMDALIRFLRLREGIVTIERVEAPYAANIIMPIDEALARVRKTMGSAEGSAENTAEHTAEHTAETSERRSERKSSPFSAARALSFTGGHANKKSDALAFLDPKSGTVRVLKPRTQPVWHGGESSETGMASDVTTRNPDRASVPPAASPRRQSSYIRAKSESAVDAWGSGAGAQQDAPPVARLVPLDKVVGLEDDLVSVVTTTTPSYPPGYFGQTSHQDLSRRAPGVAQGGFDSAALLSAQTSTQAGQTRSRENTKPLQFGSSWSTLVVEPAAPPRPPRPPAPHDREAQSSVPPAALAENEPRTEPFVPRRSGLAEGFGERPAPVFDFNTHGNADTRSSGGDEPAYVGREFSDLMLLSEPDLVLRSEEKTPVKIVPSNVMDQLQRPPLTVTTGALADFESLLVQPVAQDITEFEWFKDPAAWHARAAAPETDAQAASAHPQPGSTRSEVLFDASSDASFDASSGEWEDDWDAARLASGGRSTRRWLFAAFALLAMAVAGYLTWLSLG